MSYDETGFPDATVDENCTRSRTWYDFLGYTEEQPSCLLSTRLALGRVFHKHSKYRDVVAPRHRARNNPSGFLGFNEQEE